MRKAIIKLLSISFLLFASESNAQDNFKVSLDAGYTFSNLHQNLSSLVYTRYVGRYGFTANLSGEYLFWGPLFTKVGVSLLQKNYEYQRVGPYASAYTKYTNNYLSFPLLVGGYIINNPLKETGIWVSVAGGMYLDYWLQRKYESQQYVFSELQEDGTLPVRRVTGKYDFDKNENNLRRFGYGVQGQAQLGYSFTKLDVYAAYNYKYDIRDIYGNNEDKNKKSTPKTYSISLGVAYKF